MKHTFLILSLMATSVVSFSIGDSANVVPCMRRAFQGCPCIQWNIELTPVPKDGNSGSDSAVESPHRRVYEFNGNAYCSWQQFLSYYNSGIAYFFRKQIWRNLHLFLSTKYKKQRCFSTNQSRY